jgi:hypothetical protein
MMRAGCLRVATATLLLLVASWPLAARGQEASTPDQQPSPAPSASIQSTREVLTRLERHHEELAKLLDPATFPRAFGIGAQAEFIAPTAGVSSLVFGYDAVFLQAEASFGAGIGGDPVNDKPASNTYAFDVRVALPIHRGVRADFGLSLGGGATFVYPPEGGWYTVGEGIGGARIRMFESPNVVFAGTFGVAALIRGDHSLLVVGAKPLGSASIVYFFR